MHYPEQMGRDPRQLMEGTVMCTVRLSQLPRELS